jgi:hypothetical protein
MVYKEPRDVVKSEHCRYHPSAKEAETAPAGVVSSADAAVGTPDLARGVVEVTKASGRRGKGDGGMKKPSSAKRQAAYAAKAALKQQRREAQSAKLALEPNAALCDLSALGEEVGDLALSLPDNTEGCLQPDQTSANGAANSLATPSPPPCLQAFQQPSSEQRVTTPADQPPPSPLLWSECRSTAKVLLVGVGADEQLAGYGRHRTVYRRMGPLALAAELNKDMRRLWKRNLGRDDRVLAAWGKEARHPFLDEELSEFLHSLPLNEICDLALPPGLGDKKVLRAAAAAIGLHRTATLVKRAMQFGSRIANKNVAGYVDMSEGVDVAEIVHPSSLCGLRLRGLTACTSDRLSKKKNKRNGKPGFDSQEHDTADDGS